MAFSGPFMGCRTLPCHPPLPSRLITRSLISSPSSVHLSSSSSAAIPMSLPQPHFSFEVIGGLFLKSSTDDGAVALDWVAGDDRLLPPDSPVLIFLESNGCPLSGAVSLCDPFNLVLADEDFHKGSNNVYDKALAKSLREIFKKHALLFENIGGEYNIESAGTAKTVRDFDDGLTRVSFGFKSVDECYANSSSSDSIKYVQTPLLCIQENPNCLLIVTPKGGHLGWVAGDDAPFGSPWTDPLAIDFLQHLERGPVKSDTSQQSKEALHHLEV